jgi:hypothetical protein
MNQEIILQGVSIDALLDRVRDVVKNELRNLPAREELPTIGGLDLAVKITGLSKQSIYRFTSEGRIPHIKKNGKLYFKTSDLIQWIESGNE